jgi:hypothetical protein
MDEMKLWYVTFDTESTAAKSYLVAASDIYSAIVEGKALDFGVTRTGLTVRPGPGVVDNWPSVEAKIEADVLAEQQSTTSVIK